MGRKLFSVCLALLLILCICGAAFAGGYTTVEIPEIGKTIDIPDGFYAFTKDMNVDNPAYSALGFSKADVDSFLEQHGYSLYARTADDSYRIIVIISASDMPDFSKLADGACQEALKMYSEGIEKSGLIIVSSSVFSSGNIVYFKYGIKINDEDAAYGVMYSTVHDGKETLILGYNMRGTANPNFDIALDHVAGSVQQYTTTNKTTANIVKVLLIGAGIAAVVLLIVAAIKSLLKPKEQDKPAIPSVDSSTVIAGTKTTMEQAGLTASRAASLITFKKSSGLTKREQSQLVEITDKNVIQRITAAVPSTMEVLLNSNAVRAAQKMTVGAEPLYRAIIPKGAALSSSADMPNAVRGIYHGSEGIAGHANFVRADNAAVQNLAAVSAVNAAMSVASVVVGQYYMAQINAKLSLVNDNLDRIADFQNAEYKSKVFALVAEVQKSSTFQLETVENPELRNRELSHLKNLEHQCVELLGQASFMLDNYASRTSISYKQYETLITESQPWIQYQSILMEVTKQIQDLTYALNLGAISRENSNALLLPCLRQAAVSRGRLGDWHASTCERFGINVNAAWREREGFERFLLSVPAWLNPELKHKAIPQSVANLIRDQIELTVDEADSQDLFREDVQLVVKQGKLYYLPSIGEADMGQ